MLTSSIVVGICSALAPQMGQSMSWLRWLGLMRLARGDHLLPRAVLLPHAIRHLHGTNGLTISIPGIGEALPDGATFPRCPRRGARSARLWRDLPADCGQGKKTEFGWNQPLYVGTNTERACGCSSLHHDRAHPAALVLGGRGTKTRGCCPFLL
jgi:hypothetical protein